jgi:DNA-binding IclR family transcriptional regulator
VSKGSLVKGFVAMSTPILDHQGLLVGALSIIGVDGSLDHEAESKPVQLLLQSGERISRKLGYKGRWPLLSPVAR